jgi:hypothetical protein
MQQPSLDRQRLLQCPVQVLAVHTILTRTRKTPRLTRKLWGSGQDIYYLQTNGFGASYQPTPTCGGGGWSKRWSWSTVARQLFSNFLLSFFFRTAPHRNLSSTSTTSSSYIAFSIQCTHIFRFSQRSFP